MCSARKRSHSASGMRVMSQSLIRTLPQSGRVMPAMTCSSVVLPQPLLPTSTICSPGATWNSSISRIGRGVPSGSANDFLTSRSSSIRGQRAGAEMSDDETDGSRDYPIFLRRPPGFGSVRQALVQPENVWLPVRSAKAWRTTVAASSAGRFPAWPRPTSWPAACRAWPCPCRAPEAAWPCLP